MTQNTDAYVTDYNDLEWVDKAGPCFLDMLVKGENSQDESSYLGLLDIVILLRYMERNPNRNLFSLRLNLLNKFQELYPDHTGTLLSLISFYEKGSISERKILALSLNKVLLECKMDIVKALDHEKETNYHSALQGLFTMAQYASNMDRSETIQNPNLIRALLNIIEGKLPRETQAQ